METSPYFFFSAANKDGAALAPFSGSPSWKVTLGRSENLQRFQSASCCQATDKAGSMPPRALRRTRVSVMGIERAVFHSIGSRVVHAVESSTVKLPP